MADRPQSRILVILPALNEAGNIARAVESIRAHLPAADYVYDVVVIDDGSTDSTGAESQRAGAIVLRMPYNVGIGASVQTGFKYAAGHDYDIVVRNDGDGQHAAEHIAALIDALQSGDADMVTGSRFLAPQEGLATSLPRRIGIAILSRLVTSITGQRVTDPTSGFSAFNRRTIRLFAGQYPHDYPEPESIVILHRAGLKLKEIPVTMRARAHGASSITPVRSAYYMVKVILAILISLLRAAPRIGPE